MRLGYGIIAILQMVVFIMTFLLPQLLQQKRVMIKTTICNSYAITQKHFATTVLSLESYDSNVPLVIITLILMDSVWN